MKKVISFIFIAIVALCMTGCEDAFMTERYDFKTGRETHMTYILPNGFECVGHLAIEERGYTYLPMLICDDGTVYHNITNYRSVNQLNPLCTETK